MTESTITPTPPRSATGATGARPHRHHRRGPGRPRDGVPPRARGPPPASSSSAHARVGDQWRQPLRLAAPQHPGPVRRTARARRSRARRRAVPDRGDSSPTTTRTTPAGSASGSTAVSRVSSVEQPPRGRWSVLTDHGTYDADNVVVATGGEHPPKVPGLADQIDPGIRQLHSSDYHNPDQLLPGPSWSSGSASRAPTSPWSWPRPAARCGCPARSAARSRSTSTACRAGSGSRSSGSSGTTCSPSARRWGARPRPASARAAQRSAPAGQAAPPRRRRRTPDRGADHRRRRRQAGTGRRHRAGRRQRRVVHRATGRTSRSSTRRRSARTDGRGTGAA